MGKRVDKRVDLVKVYKILAVILTVIYAMLFAGFIFDVALFLLTVQTILLPIWYFALLIVIPPALVILASMTDYKNKLYLFTKVAGFLIITTCTFLLAQVLYNLISIPITTIIGHIQNISILGRKAKVDDSDIILMLRLFTQLIPFGLGATAIYYYAGYINNYKIKSLIERFDLLKYFGVANKDAADVILCQNEKTKKNVVISEKDRYLHMLIAGTTGSGKTSRILLPMINQDLNRMSGYLKETSKYIEDYINQGEVVFINTSKPETQYLTLADIDIPPETLDNISYYIAKKIKEMEKQVELFTSMYLKDENEETIRDKLKKERENVLNQISELSKRYSTVKNNNERYDILKQLDELRAKKSNLYYDNISSSVPSRAKRAMSEDIYKAKGYLSYVTSLKSDFSERLYYIDKIWSCFSHYKDIILRFNMTDNINIDFNEDIKKYQMFYAKINSVKGNICVSIVEPKGEDLAKKVVELCMAKGVPYYHIDPPSNNGWSYPVMAGEPDEVAEIVATVLKSLYGKQEAFFSSIQEDAVKSFVKLLKYNYGNDTDLNMLSKILRDPKQLNLEIAKLKKKNEKLNDGRIKDLIDYFNEEIISDSYTAKEMRKWLVGLRVQLDNILSSPDLSKAMSPIQNEYSVDVDKYLRNGGVLIVNTALGKYGDASSVFGKLVILTLEYAIFRRKGDGSDIPHVMYLDEFPEYVNSAFKRALTLARSYKTSCVLAVQNLTQLMEGNSKELSDIVKGNTRTKVTFGGGEVEDVKYFYELFGEDLEYDVIQSYNETASIWQPSPTSSTQRRYTQTEKPKYYKNDIENLPFGYIIYKTVDNGTSLPADLGSVSLLNDKEYIANNEIKYNIQNNFYKKYIEERYNKYIEREKNTSMPESEVYYTLITSEGQDKKQDKPTAISPIEQDNQIEDIQIEESDIEDDTSNDLATDDDLS